MLPGKPQLTKRKIVLLGGAFILFWLPVIVFSRLAGEVLEKEPIGLDGLILHWIHSQATPFYDSFFLFFTTIGNSEVILAILAALVIYLLYKRRRLHAFIALFGVGGAAVANVVLKSLFHRDRPAFWESPIVETSYSFPSGHATLSSALVISIIVIMWPTRWRWPVTITGLAVVGLIGLSRVYFGVHYPTDIVAGWSVSLAWIVIITLIAYGVSRRVHRTKKATERIENI